MKRLRDEPDVELRVGPDRVEIRAFSQLLAISSDFFDAALGTGMLEQQTKCIELPDQEPGSVRLLLEYISPGSSVSLTKDNVLTLLPLFSQFQFTVALKHADELCSRPSSMNPRGPAFVGTPARLLQLAVDHSLPKTRETALKAVKNSLRTKMSDLAPFASDARYSDVMTALWPDLRCILLSPKQQADGEMPEPPNPECCKVMWPALCHSAARCHALGNLPATSFHAFPGGNYRRATVDEDGEVLGDGQVEACQDVNDVYIATLAQSVVHHFLPNHWLATDYGRDLADDSSELPLMPEADDRVGFTFA